LAIAALWCWPAGWRCQTHFATYRQVETQTWPVIRSPRPREGPLPQGE
jgi:hypothetical protein